MESEDLVVVIDVEHAQVRTGETARIAVEVAAKMDEVAVHTIDAAEVLELRPIERLVLVEPAIFKELLALEQHRKAGRGKDQPREKGGAFLGEVASGVVGLNFLRHARAAIGDAVVRLAVDHPLQELAV